MSTLVQFLKVIFPPLVFAFTVLGMAAMGLQSRMSEVIAAFMDKRSMALTFVWGWVLGPALGKLACGGGTVGSGSATRDRIAP